MNNKYNATVEEMDKETSVYFMRYSDFMRIIDEIPPEIQMESFVMWAQVNE